MSELSSFKDELRAAAGKGHVYKVTDSYIKIRWWSLRANFVSMANWRIRCIGLRIKKRISAAQCRIDNSREAQRAARVKRADVLIDATASIGLIGR